MLLPVQALRGERADPDQRALPELHLPQPDAHVLPQRVPLHQARGEELRRREEGGRVLSHNQVPAG